MPQDYAELERRLRERAPYYEEWARDIRAMNGTSVDADHADATARDLREAANALASMREALEEAYAADAQKTREWNIMAQENRALTRQLEEAMIVIAPVAAEVSRLRASPIRDLEDDYLSLSWSDMEEDKATDAALHALFQFSVRLSRTSTAKAPSEPLRNHLEQGKAEPAADAEK